MLFAVRLRSMLFTRCSSVLEPTRPQREQPVGLGAAVFLLLVEYYLAWITWYQKPETMASCALLAATVWLLSVPLPLPRGMAIGGGGAGMVLLAAMQGFVRADVAFAIHLGVLLLCFAGPANAFALPRGLQGAISLTAVLTSGGIQYYLMHVAYPDARYAPGRVFQGLVNIAYPLRLVPFALFMLPYAWLVVQQFRKRCGEEPAPLALLGGSAIYLALWWALGNFDEVRIFLPYGLALVPLTARVCDATRCKGRRARFQANGSSFFRVSLGHMSQLDGIRPAGEVLLHR